MWRKKAISDFIEKKNLVRNPRMSEVQSIGHILASEAFRILANLRV